MMTVTCNVYVQHLWLPTSVCVPWVTYAAMDARKCNVNTLRVSQFTWYPTVVVFAVYCMPAFKMKLSLAKNTFLALSSALMCMKVSFSRTMVKVLSLFFKVGRMF